MISVVKTNIIYQDRTAELFNIGKIFVDRSRGIAIYHKWRVSTVTQLWLVYNLHS